MTVMDIHSVGIQLLTAPMVKPIFAYLENCTLDNPIEEFTATRKISLFSETIFRQM